MLHEDPIYFQQAGEQHYYLGNYRKAIQYYNAYFGSCNIYGASDAEKSRTYVYRGLAYTKLKLTEEAIEDFTAAIALDPKNDHAYSNRSHQYKTSKQFELALADINKAIECNPRDSYYYFRGGIYKALKQYQASADDYHQAITLNPQKAHYYYNLSIIDAILKKPENAIHHLNIAICLNPTIHNFYFQRGQLSFNRFFKGGSLDSYNPKNPEESQEFSSRGYEEAIADFQKAIELNPDQELYVLACGHAYLKIGFYNEAISYLINLLDLNDRNQWGYCYLTQALFASAEKNIEEINLHLNYICEYNTEKFSDYQQKIFNLINKTIEHYSCVLSCIEAMNSFKYIEQDIPWNQKKIQLRLNSLENKIQILQENRKTINNWPSLEKSINRYDHEVNKLQPPLQKPCHATTNVLAKESKKHKKSHATKKTKSNKKTPSVTQPSAQSLQQSSATLFATTFATTTVQETRASENSRSNSNKSR